MSVRDPAAAIVHALTVDAAAAGVALADVTVASCAWASATFVGHRHRLGATPAGAGSAAWLARLSDVEWLVPGRLIADVAVLRLADGRVEIAVLDLDDHRPPIDS